MPASLEIVFRALADSPEPVAALLVGKDAALGKVGKSLDKQTDQQLSRSMSAAGFKAGAKSSLVLHAPNGSDLKRLVLVGAGDAAKATAQDWVVVGGHACGQLMSAKTETASFIADVGAIDAQAAADVAMGALLRRYTFDIYKTSKTSDAEANGDATTASASLRQLVIHTDKPADAAEAFEARKAVADGVCLARDLVNEPANVLGPVEFAERCKALEAVGVEVEILEVAEIEELKMGALLAVAQGSARPARVAVMQWHGAKSKRTKPLCFIGKGVCFDTGGISMKPAAGMEDM
ncbi:MAG: leucyl aminopeptidase, partial [Hyphomicrobiaceae bacterium]|nr:leucyl aminopeptidase [Hyphomicrobiaceae bacterium]